jgi:hypothetical protein
VDFFDEPGLFDTGAPAASADAVSPPATEKASGKLLAPNTATGPSGMFARRRSARQRFSFRLRLVDRGIDEATVARDREAGFRVGAFDQLIADADDIVSDRFQEGGARRQRQLAGRMPAR